MAIKCQNKKIGHEKLWIHEIREWIIKSANWSSNQKMDHGSKDHAITHVKKLKQKLTVIWPASQDVWGNASTRSRGRATAAGSGGGTEGTGGTWAENMLQNKRTSVWQWPRPPELAHVVPAVCAEHAHVLETEPHLHILRSLVTANLALAGVGQTLGGQSSQGLCRGKEILMTLFKTLILPLERT